MKLKKSKILVFIFLFSTINILMACVSNKNELMKSLDLQIMILDETNQPVSDFKLYYSKKENGFKSQEKYTNEKGFCNFEDVPSGTCYIWGLKHGYTRIQGIPVSTRNATGIFFCATESKKSVFENTINLFKNKRFSEGLENISRLEADKNSILEEGIRFFQLYGKSQNTTVYTKELRKEFASLKKECHMEIQNLIEEIERRFVNE